MTDPLAPLTDEDLSAVIDGEADAATVARVAADPVAQVRLAQLRAAADSVGQPVTPLAASVVDTLVDRALAATEADADPAAAANGDHVVAPLAPAKRPKAPGWLVAAVVVALMGIGLGLVWSGRDTGSTQTAGGRTDQATESASQESKGGGAGSGADPSVDDAAATTTDAAVPPHGLDTTTTTPDAGEPAADLQPLGSFASSTALREALKTSFPTRSANSAATGSSGEGAERPTNLQVGRCRDQLMTILSITSAPTHTGLATVDGKAVLVYEFPTKSVADGTPTTLVAGVGQTSCDPVVTFER